MTMTIYEPYRVLAWLQATLTPLATGGAWQGVEPPGIASPFIVYALDAPSDIVGVAGTRLWNSSLYSVKVVGTAAQDAQLASIADDIDAALQLVGDFDIGPNSDGHLMRCVREGPLPIPVEIVNGVSWITYGALWRIQARRAS